MKKSNLNNKLAFNKADVTELNTQQLQIVNGGVKEDGETGLSGCICNPLQTKITIIKS